MKNEVEARLVLRREPEGHATLFLITDEREEHRRAIGFVDNVEACDLSGIGEGLVPDSGTRGYFVSAWSLERLCGELLLRLQHASAPLILVQLEADDFWAALRAKYPASPTGAWKLVLDGFNDVPEGMTWDDVRRILPHSSTCEVDTILREMVAAGLLSSKAFGLWHRVSVDSVQHQQVEDDFWGDLRKRFPRASHVAWKRVLDDLDDSFTHGATWDEMCDSLRGYTEDEAGAVLQEMIDAGVVEKDPDGMWCPRAWRKK